MKMRHFCQGVFIFVCLFSSQGLAARKSDDLLSEIDARERAKVVANPKYEIDVDLSGKEDPTKYQGSVVISFDLTAVPAELTVDFRGGQLTASAVNGKVAKLPYNGAFITVPGETLKVGANAVKLTFNHPFSKDGSGLYRFVDPQDQKVYIYSDFEPYDASRFVPMFDQPDLRASYKLAAMVPESWQVVTSVRENKISNVSTDIKRWEFPESAVFSTYVFSLHAGPYHIWEDKAGDIPLRLMVRQSMKDYVPKDFWMTITKQGLNFFQKYFAHNYPYIKYDQVIVPDFNSGAMENVAAVTFSERYLRKGDQTRKERERMAEVILHEMAHMWFGNLVTMRWWNDLWLNESFATYMASLALGQATEFKESWLSFANSKEWAYWEDGLVTKHPITTDVPDTNQAFANFDGITYGKGASVLKQLAFFVGEDAFTKGVQLYFKKHAGKNTELKDFIRALAAAAGRDLNGFTREWLETAGTNTIKADFTCEANKIKSFSIVQSGDQGDLQTRSHRTIVALLNKSPTGDKLVVTSEIPVAYNGARTEVKEAIGQACPEFVHPNNNDYDFVKVELDDRSLSAAKISLRSIDDAILRSLTWTSLWNMVRQAKLPVQAYSELVKQHLPYENELLIARSVAGTIRGGGGAISASVINYLPRETKEQLRARDHAVEAWENVFLSLMEKAPPGSDWQKLWFDSYVEVAETPKAMVQLNKVLSKDYVPQGFAVDQNRRWNIVVRLGAADVGNLDNLITHELSIDPSSDGRKSSLAAKAARPAGAVKEQWFNEITNLKNNYTLAERRTVMRNLFPAGQEHFRAKYTKRFFSNVKTLAKENNETFLANFIRELSPARCASSSVDEISTFLKRDGSTLPSYALKGLRVAHQEDERCVKIRQRALAYPLKQQNAPAKSQKS